MDLIKACEIIAQKGYSIELVQIGKIVDKDLKTYISKKGIGHWCKLCDAKPLSDMPAMVARCDFTSSSLSQFYGMEGVKSYKTYGVSGNGETGACT